MMSHIILLLSDKTPGGGGGGAARPLQPPDCIFYNGHMPRAGLGGNGALNYGEAEFQIFQIHLPICILQLKGCKQERDKEAGKAASLHYDVRGSSFPLEKHHI